MYLKDIYKYRKLMIKSAKKFTHISKHFISIDAKTFYRIGWSWTWLNFSFYMTITLNVCNIYINKIFKICWRKGVSNEQTFLYLATATTIDFDSDKNTVQLSIWGFLWKVSIRLCKMIISRTLLNSLSCACCASRLGLSCETTVKRSQTQ